MDQATKIQDAEKRYDQGVKQDASAGEMKKLHDEKVWEQTKSHVCGLASSEAAKKALEEQKKKK